MGKEMRKKLMAITWLAIIIMVGCRGSSERAGEKRPEELSGVILIDGSSTVFPITEAVAEEFQKKFPAVRVTVGISGTGGGFKKFYGRETDISNASRPIRDSEQKECEKKGIEFIELPVAFDGLAVVVNPQNDWCNWMSVKELKQLWEPEAQGKIMRWNQIRPDWPDEEIHLYGAGVDSGTYDYFTEAIVGKEHSSRGDYTASEDDNVLVQGISTDKYALGFFGLAYYEANRNKLKLVAIDDENPENGNGPILPTEETVANGTYQPLSRPIFIYVRKDSLETKPHVEEFVRFYIKMAPTLVKEVGYIPLPSHAYEMVMRKLENRVTGTAFSGSKVGLSIEELIGR